LAAEGKDERIASGALKAVGGKLSREFLQFKHTAYQTKRPWKSGRLATTKLAQQRGGGTRESRLTKKSKGAGIGKTAFRLRQNENRRKTMRKEFGNSGKEEVYDSLFDLTGHAT